MLGLDEMIVELGADGGLAVALLIAVLVGLRHATDPDHLTAVATLVVSDPTGARRAGLLGLLWGAGHAVTLTALGMPVVLWGDMLPDAAQHTAELLVGVLIVVLAIRLLVRSRRGYFHVHEHRHGADAERPHAHPHFHPHRDPSEHPAEHEHRHGHAEGLGRTPAAAFGIGLLHGAGGSAGAGILLVSAIPGRATAAAALVIFALGSAAAMAAVSYGFGTSLSGSWLRQRLDTLAPALGAAGLAFGVWYALAATGAVPYAF